MQTHVGKSSFNALILLRELLRLNSFVSKSILSLPARAAHQAPENSIIPSKLRGKYSKLHPNSSLVQAYASVLATNVLEMFEGSTPVPLGTVTSVQMLSVTSPGTCSSLAPSVSCLYKTNTARIS